MGLSQFDLTNPLVWEAEILSGDGLNQKPVTTIEAYWRQIQLFLLSNTDGIAHAVTVFIDNGVTAYLIGSVNVAAGAGTLGAPAAEFVSVSLPAAYPYVNLPGGCRLLFSVNPAMVGASQLQGVAIGGRGP